MELAFRDSFTLVFTKRSSLNKNQHTFGFVYSMHLVPMLDTESSGGNIFVLLTQVLQIKSINISFKIYK